MAASGISPGFMASIERERLETATVLDVGTGWGRLALALAPRCARVIGIEREPSLVDEGRQRVRAAGLTNVELVVADAEAIEYTSFRPDLVVAHLCFSGAIVERAARALARGRVLAAVAFHADQWRETGRRSRFAHDETEARRLLENAGFAVEHLSVEREVREFTSVEEGQAAAAELEARWRADGRWPRYLAFLEAGGRTLTRSHLLMKARRR